MERQRLDADLRGVRSGHSAVLVMRGEAGIGKTTLLEYVAGQASGFRLARIAGVESELDLPFAALHQLCRPMIELILRLPEPQARALRVAFGDDTGAAPDKFMVGLAVLGLLADVVFPLWWALAATIPIVYVAWWVAYRSDWF